MSAPAPTTTDPTAPDLAVTCAQVRGGNGRISVPLVLPGLRGALRSDPADGGRGGDVYYLSICGSGLLTRICLADLCGHGERVAVLGREIHALLQRYADRPDQRRLLSDLNGALLPIGLKAMTTAAVITYYPPRRSVSFTYAGHPPGWFYCSRTERWAPLEADASADDASARDLVNGPLGVQESIRFTRSSRRAVAGDRIVLVTDGVLETPGGARDYFGNARLGAALHDHRTASIDALADGVLDALTAFRGAPGFDHDDVTIMAFEVTKPPPGTVLWQVLRNRVLRPLGLMAAPEYGAPA